MSKVRIQYVNIANISWRNVFRKRLQLCSLVFQTPDWPNHLTYFVLWCAFPFTLCFKPFLCLSFKLCGYALPLPAPHKNGHGEHTTTLALGREVEAGGSEAQCHPQQYTEFKSSLRHMRLLKQDSVLTALFTSYSQRKW